MSLRTRIFTYVVAIMGIVFVMVIATLLPDAMHLKHRFAIGQKMGHALKATLEQLTSDQRRDMLTAHPHLFLDQQLLDGWVLINENGVPVVWMMPSEKPDKASAEFVTGQHFDYWNTVFTRDHERLVLYARTNTSSADASLDVWGIFWVMVLGALVLVLVLYGFMLRLIIKPVERLAAASRSTAFVKGLLHQVPHTDREDEIGELIRAYNNMTNEVNDLRLNLERRVTEATTNLEAAQSQLVLSERLSVAGRMAAGVAHEINNPLGGMLNATRALKTKAVPGSRDGEYLDLVLDGLGRIQAIVTTMLQFSRPTQQASSVDLKAVIEGALLFCEHRFETMNLQIEKDFTSSGNPVFFIMGYRSELGQVFLNLFVNALDAMDAKESGPHHLKVQLRHENDAVIASVVDNGIGMPAPVKERAGQFFYSTKGEGKGTGLGLAVVQHIVMRHGGWLSIDSTEGQGTTVTLTLPVNSLS